MAGYGAPPSGDGARGVTTAAVRALLGAILVVAFALRLHGLDWGLPYLWHPDEKLHIVGLMIYEGRLDPKHFINPSFHLYQVWAAVQLAYWWYPGQYLVVSLHRILPLSDPAHPGRGVQFLAARLSRGVSVLWSVATVGLLFWMGRRTFNVRVGLLAAAFAAVTMGLTSLAHFGTPESVMFCLCLATLAACERVATAGDRRGYVLAGAMLGLAVSTKFTAFVLGAPVLAAHLWGRGWRRAFDLQGLGLLLLCGLVSQVAFFGTTPYAILNWPEFREALDIVWRTGAPEGSLAAAGRSWDAYALWIVNGLGVPLAAWAAGGLVLAARGAWRALRARWHRDAVADGRAVPPAAAAAYVVHLTWIVTYVAFYGMSPHNALRFIMPIAPSLLLLGAVCADRALAMPARRMRRAAAALLVVTGVYSVAYCLEATRMLRHDTRYQAGAWLRSLTLPGYAPVNYFGPEAYLPWFDQPEFRVIYVPFVANRTLTGEAFRAEAEGYLRHTWSLVVDARYYYQRFLDMEDIWPERAAFYRAMLNGRHGPEGYHVVKRFTYPARWWLAPKPEFASPEIVFFAKQELVDDIRTLTGHPGPLTADR